MGGWPWNRQQMVAIPKSQVLLQSVPEGPTQEAEQWVEMAGGCEHKGASPALAPVTES